MTGMKPRDLVNKVGITVEAVAVEVLKEMNQSHCKKVEVYAFIDYSRDQIAIKAVR